MRAKFLLSRRRLYIATLAFALSLGSHGSLADAVAPEAPSPPPSVKPNSAAVPGPSSSSSVNEPPFLESFPHLKDYLYREPSSGLYLGMGLSPIGFLKDRLMLTADFFQVHWLNERWDLELFNAALSLTRAQSTSVQSTQFTIRTAPKYRLFEHFSFGPVVGYEFVSFPNISAKLSRGNLFSPSEPFSSRGWIYGVMTTETFKLTGDYILQINEIGYQQTYSTSRTAQEWNYYFNNADIRNDPSQIQATFVFMVDVNFLY